MNVLWKIEASSRWVVCQSDVRRVYTVRGKVISEGPINRSDTQRPKHMFLISSGSNNIMVEEFTAAVISCYQRLTLVWRDSRGGLTGLKPLGT